MKRHGHFKLTPAEELDIVNRYLNGESTRKIAETSVLGKTAISSLLSRHGVETKGKGNSYRLRKYSVDHSYFSTIDSPEKAYWLGFISADGHVSDEAIEINLHKRDAGHLTKFLESIGSDSPLKYQRDAVCIDVYSKEMVKDLRELGLMRNKSQTHVFADISDDLHVHYIRGLFDGDGSIKTSESLMFSGTSKTMGSLKKIVMDMCDVSDTKPTIRANDFMIVEWSGRRQFTRIMDWLYQDAPVYLDRKYKRYLELKGE